MVKYDTIQSLLKSCSSVVAAGISDKERDWKLQFDEWSTHYIVNWKTEFDEFLRQRNSRDRCSGDEGDNRRWCKSNFDATWCVQSLLSDHGKAPATAAALNDSSFQTQDGLLWPGIETAGTGKKKEEVEVKEDIRTAPAAAASWTVALVYQFRETYRKTERGNETDRERQTYKDREEWCSLGGIQAWWWRPPGLLTSSHSVQVSLYWRRTLNQMLLWRCQPSLRKLRHCCSDG